MAGLAAGLPVPALLAAPSKCQLTCSGAGGFTTGHIDVVLPDGRVPCSSVRKSGAPSGASHAGADWLTDKEALRSPGVAGTFLDSLTGQLALAITAPVAG